MKRNITLYHCKSMSEAIDRANILYIEINRATAIERETEERVINLRDRKNNIILSLTY